MQQFFFLIYYADEIRLDDYAIRHTILVQVNRASCEGSVHDNANLKSNRRCSNMSRMNLPGHVEHVPIFSRMYTIACCLVVVGLGLALGLGLDLVSGC